MPNSKTTRKAHWVKHTRTHLLLPRDAPYRWKTCCHSRSFKVIRNYTAE